MPISPSLESALADVKNRLQINGVGFLGTALVLTRKAVKLGLPLDPSAILTAGGGQVSGLSGANINKILKDHGVTQMVGTESGRTSRATPALASEYAAFLNSLHGVTDDDLTSMEEWWVARFVDYFNTEPFKLNHDTSRTFAVVIRNLLDQAIERQKKAPGKTYAGAMLQHLVGAKLTLALPKLTIGHNGASVADTVSARSGDFVIDNSIIHCTTAPGEALIKKCVANLQAGQRPIILTIARQMGAAEGLAETYGIDGRVEIMDAVQFLAANLYELSLFQAVDQRPTVVKLIEQYNQIVSEHEADASLRIAVD